MLDRNVFLFTLMMAVVGSAPSAARTWIVERDGSGEFTSIHSAVYSSSAGDTIMIGPGRYDDFHPLVAPAWTTEAIVEVTIDSLTFIGSGNTATIIGPTQMYLPPGIAPEPMAVAALDTVTAKFMNIGFENVRNGVYWANGRVTIEGCRFDGCVVGVFMYGEGGGNISGSKFYSEESLAKGILLFSPCGPVTIEGSTFGGPDVNEQGVSINGVNNVSILSCHFYARSAIIFAGSSGIVGNCTTTTTVGQSVWVTDASIVELAGNQLHGYFESIYVDGWSTVNGTGNVFTGGDNLATIYITSQSQVTLNGNDILKTGKYAAKIGQYFYEIVTNDLTGNFWGTSNTDSIAVWIWDYNDDPITRSYIDFDPFSGSTVPNESRSFGSIKSMFR